MPKKPSFKSLISFSSSSLLRYLRRVGATSLPIMADLDAERNTLLSKLRRIRYVSIFIGFCNLAVTVAGGFLAVSGCKAVYKVGFLTSALMSGFRVVAMVGAGVAQHEIAEMIAKYPFDEAAGDAVVRHARRLRYKRWLWWTRLGMAVTVLQFIGAVHLTYVVISSLSHNESSIACHIGQHTDSLISEKILVVSFMALVWLVVLIQCFTGSDILRWRSFYATHDTAWKAHYREVFDHGIREALCCLGRAKYLSVLEEDEVYSVARVLGDLLAYRASGTGHLELLAGLALLQSHKQSDNIRNDFLEAPTELIKEAAFFHQFAEAAYTGPLLDFGRNPILFPCAWLYRQGVFTPWTRNSRPLLEGDNWWRGHAAAFLKSVNLPANALRRGRVNQTRRGAAYFVLVLHDRRSVVIAVRGTETPEDLITDGLCRECPLNHEDLDGIINGENIPYAVKHKVLSSFPHYGHAGIVECARELFIQIDGNQGGRDGLHDEKPGFLSSLLSQQGECFGYNIHIVGHSLGGAIATLLGVRLYRRYPNLNVYAYGSLPCLDAVIAEACSNFVTTIVYNDEFSARLSINSITRLRAAAINALSDNSSADAAIIQKLARRILHVNKYQANGEQHNGHALEFRSTNASVEINHVHKRRNFRSVVQGSSLVNKEPNLEEISLLDASDSEIMVNYSNEIINRSLANENLFNAANCEQSCMRSDEIISINDQISQCVEVQSSAEVLLAPPEMFLAGRIIHIVQEPARILPLWKKWNLRGKEQVFRAVLADREIFKDIVVTPFMFIDHLPWRCHYAMQRVLEMRKSHCTNSDTFNGEALA